MINSQLVRDLCEELNNVLAGGRIDKIQQPAKGIVVLTVRNNYNNYKVLISTSSGKARIHITENSYENPLEPPMFCMLLRKHLQGNRIIAFTQINDDKIIKIETCGFDELDRNSTKYIIVEMIGRMPNIILTDDTEHIIDCIYRREFRNPGLIYRSPEKPESYYDVKYNKVNNISQFLDEYYSKVEMEELYRSKSKQLRTQLNNTIKRTEKKLGARMIELSKTESREEIRQRADLIKANLWKIKKGDSVLCCENYFEDCSTIYINLDPILTPQQYITKLYKEYNKLKKAELYLSDLIIEAENQLEYLKSEADLLSRAKTDKEIDEIKLELVKEGFIKQSSSTKSKTVKNEPLILTTPSQKTVYVGKNNTQNDYITFKAAYKSDYWFHAKDYHGSHVVLLCNGEIPDDSDIYFAAKLAADNSQAKGNCFVDYCQIKNVKKQKGSMPGKVIYSEYTTIKVQ